MVIVARYIFFLAVCLMRYSPLLSIALFLPLFAFVIVRI